MENDDSAMLHSKAMIVNNLSMLVKNKCMVSANLGGKDTLLTAIVEINHKESTLILDYSASEHLNKRMTTMPAVKFTTGFNGIQVAFTGHNIKKTKHKGEDAFVMPIPASLYWYNRREYFRVNTPLMNPSSCEIVLLPPTEYSTDEYKDAFRVATDVIREGLAAKIAEEIAEEQKAFLKAYAKMSVEAKIKAKAERQDLEAERAVNPPVPDENLVNILVLNLRDISLSGMSLHNRNPVFSYFLEAQATLSNCVLNLPGHGEVTISFEIVSKRMGESQKPTDFNEMIGAKFVNLKAGAESAILRYIQDVERQSNVSNL
jgi:c-di-GMP-binding flagellar brake protein YcgR